MAGVSVEDVDGLRRQIPLPMSTLKQTIKLSFIDDTVLLKDNFIMDHTTGVHVLCFTVIETNHPPLRSNRSSRVQCRGLYFEVPLYWSPQPKPLFPMVCCPFQNKWGSKYLNSNPMAFLVMQMYLSLSSSYIIPRFMTEVHHDLSLLLKPRRNANFPCVRLPLRHLGIPLMQSKFGRNSKAFDHRQTNKKSNKNSHPIVKMIRKGPVELK